MANLHFFRCTVLLRCYALASHSRDGKIVGVDLLMKGDLMSFEATDIRCRRH